MMTRPSARRSAAVRREPPDHLRAQPGHGDLIASAPQAADEVWRLRRDLLNGGEVQLQWRLASTAQRIAGLAETSADLRGAELEERQPDGAGQRVSKAEGLAIRHLVAAPAQLAAIGGWLRPGHFTNAQHRAIYRVVRDLAAEGHPVDQVTVAWEAGRRGIPVNVADLSDGTAPFAIAAARDVARHGILTQIIQAARDLRASAAGHQPSTAVLLRGRVGCQRPGRHRLRPVAAACRARAGGPSSEGSAHESPRCDGGRGPRRASPGTSRLPEDAAASAVDPDDRDACQDGARHAAAVSALLTGRPGRDGAGDLRRLRPGRPGASG